VGGGTPILYLDDPKGIDRKSRRKMLDDIAKLNAMRLDQSGDPEIATRNFQYDMAYRMQASAPEITDLTDEPESTFKLYGEDARIPGTYAYNCLLARRMAERDRSLHPAFPPRLGPTQLTRPPPNRPMQRHRPSIRRTRDRPQTTRHARRHPSHLGR